MRVDKANRLIALAKGFHIDILGDVRLHVNRVGVLLTDTGLDLAPSGYTAKMVRNENYTPVHLIEQLQGFSPWPAVQVRSTTLALRLKALKGYQDIPHSKACDVRRMVLVGDGRMWVTNYAIARSFPVEDCGERFAFKSDTLHPELLHVLSDTERKTIVAPNGENVTIASNGWRVEVQRALPQKWPDVDKLLQPSAPRWFGIKLARVAEYVRECKKLGLLPRLRLTLDGAVELYHVNIEEGLYERYGLRGYQAPTLEVERIPHTEGEGPMAIDPKDFALLACCIDFERTARMIIDPTYLLVEYDAKRRTHAKIGLLTHLVSFELCSGW